MRLHLRACGLQQVANLVAVHLQEGHAHHELTIGCLRGGIARVSRSKEREGGGGWGGAGAASTPVTLYSTHAPFRLPRLDAHPFDGSRDLVDSPPDHARVGLVTLHGPRLPRRRLPVREHGAVEPCWHRAHDLRRHGVKHQRIGARLVKHVVCRHGEEGGARRRGV